MNNRDESHDQAIANLQQLTAMTGRSDLTGQILEEVVKKKAKLSDAEFELAKAIAVPAWKFIWKKIKAKLKIGNPTAN